MSNSSNHNNDYTEAWTLYTNQAIPAFGEEEGEGEFSKFFRKVHLISCNNENTVRCKVWATESEPWRKDNSIEIVTLIDLSLQNVAFHRVSSCQQILQLEYDRGDCITLQFYMIYSIINGDIFKIE